ncbi:putative periplasmic pilin chaperone [Escherichia coli]|uniref:Putative periplasmic pilin chaperone n=1 Tax=Escherichia coli TaxID=562 RepID=A0A376U6L9_ECOLX|nr:putative periplasmic pilin chaperone [Escherichia coli]
MKGLLSLLIFSMVLPAHAGIVIYGTRIIYPAENKEVMVQLMNQRKPFFAAAGVD